MANAQILVVEDNKIVAKDAQNRLNRSGYGVTAVVSSGEEAIQKAAEMHPDLVLMDVVLKGDMDGVEAAQHIRTQLDIPVVYLTAYADEDTLQRAKVTEPFGYVLKPFEDRELYTAIEMALYKHRMERKLRESERWLATILNSIGDAVVATDIGGRVMFMNPVAEALTGWKQDEALGKDLTEVIAIVNEETGARIENLAARVLREGVMVGLANHSILVARDGTEIPVDDSAAPIKDEAGAVTGIVLVFHDITERVRAEEEIRWRAETLAALHETALDLAAQRALPDLLRAIVVRAVDLLKAKEGGFFFYRPATDDLERVIAYNFDLDPKWTVLRRGEGLAGKVLENGRPLAVDNYGQWEGRLEQYQEDHFAIVGVPVFWGDRLLGVLDVTDDIPRTFSPADIALLERFTPLAAAALENNRLVRDLEQQMDKLRETQAQLVQTAKLAAVGELSAGVAHELNNPLTSVLGFAEWLLRSLAPDAPERHDLETIAREARRARDIVRNLLDFARQTKPLREPSDVNQVLQQTLALIRQHLEKSGVVIAEEYAPEIGLVSLDGGRMKQVFLNLITNAAQAMPGGGTLLVRTVRVGNEVAVSMADTGAGIPPEVQERIFDPFFSTKPSGTGLGLSVSLGIVEEHGGRITVESQVGQGSTFTVWLPTETVRGGRHL